MAAEELTVEYQSPKIIRAAGDYRSGGKAAEGAPALKGSGGDGTHGGLEPRVRSLETHIDYMRQQLGDMRTDIRSLRTDGERDFRIVFGTIITVALGLAGLMAKGFHWF
jgi:hypothetical protein